MVLLDIIVTKISLHFKRPFNSSRYLHCESI